MIRNLKRKIEEKHAQYPSLGVIALISGITLWATSGFLYYRAYTATKPFKHDLAYYTAQSQILSTPETLEKTIDDNVKEFYVNYKSAKTRRNIYFGTAATIGKVGSLFVLTGFPLVFLKKKKKDA